MVGGAYLCFEGVEKLAHRFLHDPAEDAAHRAEHLRALADPAADVLAVEREKIRGAIRTDFILSAEIVAISLASVEGERFAVRVGVLSAIAAVLTVGVYGLVAGIVKLDDAGLRLSRAEGEGGGARARRAAGRTILRCAPLLMRALSVAGTTAMFLVGGGILTHGVPPLHHAIEGFSRSAGDAFEGLVTMAVEGAVGVVAGTALLAVVSGTRRAFRRRAPAAPADGGAAGRS
jgi:hypothetical protein